LIFEAAVEDTLIMVFGSCKSGLSMGPTPVRPVPVQFKLYAPR
jgi:hypothetical protein